MNVATPCAFTVPVPIVAPASLKATDPVGIPPVALVSVAVKVSGCPAVTGDPLSASASVVPVDWITSPTDVELLTA